MQKEPFIGSDGKCHYLYRIDSLLPDKPYYYIGQHTTSKLNDGYWGSGTKWKRILKGLGRENFKKEILGFCETVSELCQEEIDLIKEHLGKPWNCNLVGGGNVTTGYKFTDEQRERFSKAQKGKHPHQGVLNNQYGLKRSEETKKKMSEAQKARHYKVSEETRKKLREAHLGKKQSEETRRKRSKSSLGLKRTPEQCLNISKAKMGDKNPAKRLEVRLKISQTLRERNKNKRENV